MYKDIRHSKLCSTRLEASWGPRTEGVPTNNQRGWGSGPCLLWGGLDKSRHLLVRVQCFKKDLYRLKAAEGQSTRPIALSVITGSYFRRHLTIFEPDETKFALHLTFLSLKSRLPKKTGWKIPSETNPKIFHQMLIKTQSMTWRTF